MRRRDSYEDYCKEIDEVAEKKAHDADQCEGPPVCGYCLDDQAEAEREEADKRGYYDSKGRWTT